MKYYQELLYVSAESPEKEAKKFLGLFKPINWFKTRGNSVKTKQSIRDIYHQVIKNTFTILLSLMRVYDVSDEVLHKLEEYLKSAIAKL